MAFNLSKLKGDPEKESNGIWVDEADGLRLLIASARNPKYLEAVRTNLLGKAKFDKTKLQTRLNRKGMLSNLEEEAFGAARVAAAKYILLDWENLEEEKDGKLVPVPYSQEKALEIFVQVPEFYSIVMEYAADFSRFEIETKEESAKNS